MENEIELKPFDKVLVRDKDTDIWRIDIFGAYETYFFESGFHCLEAEWKQCIPYEGNEHLLGTSDSPQKEEEQEEKQDGVDDNYGYPVEYFKQGDVVLCRDAQYGKWRITSFVGKGTEQYPFECSSYIWKQCIPYEGNEHLLGATDEPERYDTDKNTLFGVKLNPGYVLEFEDDEVGILFPTANGFAVSYVKGMWQLLKSIKKDSIVRIVGIAQTDYLRSGETLWERPQKQTLTKAQIAEKLGISEQDFEIVDEENK